MSPPSGSLPPAITARTVGVAALLAVAVGLLAYGSLLVPQDYGRAAPIWIANALTVVFVLRGAPGRWPLWVAAGFIGNFAADVAVGNTLITSAALAPRARRTPISCVRWPTM